MHKKPSAAHGLECVRLGIHAATLVFGADDRGRLIRRTLVRWLNLAQLFMLRSVSIPVKLRFMTCESIRDAGFMTNSEYEYYASVFTLPEGQCKENSNGNDDTSTNAESAQNAAPTVRTVHKLQEETIMQRRPALSGVYKKRKDSIAAGALNSASTAKVPKRYCRGLENDMVWLLPLQWCCILAARARKEGRIKSDLALAQIVSGLCDARDNLMALKCYDWISIPLVYTQVATLAVYSYFLPSLMSRQYLDPSKRYNSHEIDLYVPVFLVLEFLFYLGWLKVAEALIYPLGSQDDHFEINGIIDRNTAIGFIFADTEHNAVPSVVKDYHFDEHDALLPHTVASFGNHDHAPVGSAQNFRPHAQRHQLADTMSVFAPGSPSTNSPQGFGRKLSTFLTSPMENIFPRKHWDNESKRSGSIQSQPMFSGLHKDAQDTIYEQADEPHTSKHCFSNELFVEDEENKEQAASDHKQNDTGPSDVWFTRL